MTAMKRGTISEQYMKVPHKGKAQPVLRGPYYVFSRREGNKTVSVRLTNAAMLSETREAVAAYHRFCELTKEFVELTEAFGEIKQGEIEREEVKKKPKWRLNQTGK